MRRSRSIAKASRSLPATSPQTWRIGAAHAAPFSRRRLAGERDDGGARFSVTRGEIMSEAVLHKVRFEPVGIEMDVEEGETVLNAAFRQGIALMHGCKEGQCASCKSRLVSGDIELLKYSTFALPDDEQETEHVRPYGTRAYRDIEVELLNYDEDLVSRPI